MHGSGPEPARPGQPTPPSPAPQAQPKIVHTTPGFAPAASSDQAESPASAPAEGTTEPQPSATQAQLSPTPKPIRTFGDRKRHEDSWDRTPNTTGTGAIHVKTFHSKLTDEAMTYLDQQINEWLDAHPQYEVKFTSTSIGDFTGKLKEPHLIVQVWV